jgi:hypothetical protein
MVAVPSATPLISKLETLSVSDIKLSKSKRSVSFDLERNTTRLFEEKEVQPQEIWFLGDDHTDMKNRCKVEAREWRKLGYSVLLNDSFEQPRNDVQDYLNAFAQLPERLNRRGIERQCSRKHGDERSELKERARQSVLRSQEEYKTQSISQEELAEKLSQSYISACRCARIFARRVGKADEVEMQRLDRLDALGYDVPSELVERIFEQNGIVPPEQSKRTMQRRLSNFSTASGISLQSYDSQRQKGRRIHDSSPTSNQLLSGSCNNSNHSYSATSVGSNRSISGSSVGSGRSSVSSGRSNVNNSRRGHHRGQGSGHNEELYAAIA